MTDDELLDAKRVTGDVKRALSASVLAGIDMDVVCDLERNAVARVASGAAKRGEPDEHD
jgi:hypothetical protein